MLFVALAKCYR